MEENRNWGLLWLHTVLVECVRRAVSHFPVRCIVRDQPVCWSPVKLSHVVFACISSSSGSSWRTCTSERRSLLWRWMTLTGEEKWSLWRLTLDLCVSIRDHRIAGFHLIHATIQMFAKLIMLLNVINASCYYYELING